MRLIIVVLAALATGCLDAPVETTSTASSDLTYSLPYSYSSPRLEVIARIARYRQAADELRAVGATKPSAYMTWSAMEEYRAMVQFDHDSADKLDYAADTLEAQLATTNDVDSLAEMSEMEQLRMQMMMDRNQKMLSTLSNMVKKMSETTQAIIDNIK